MSDEIVTAVIAVLGSILGAMITVGVPLYFKYFYNPRIHSRERSNIQDVEQQNNIVESVDALKTQNATEVGMEPIYVGAFGYPGEGTHFCHSGYDGIKKIIIYCKSVIESIEVQYIKNGQIECSNKIGGKSGKCEEFVLDDDEYLIEVKGFYGRRRLFRMGVISTLTFISNKKDKSYGIDKGTQNATILEEPEPTPFHVKGGKIVGLHGTQGNFLSSIGFYIAPLEYEEALSTYMGKVIGMEPVYMGPCGYQGEGAPFYHYGYDGIKKIIIFHKTMIDSIEVHYTKDRQILCPNKVGGIGGNREEIILEEDEYLTEVNGSYGRFDNIGALISITFISNLHKKLGPYGNEGTNLENKLPFNLKGGKIVGFHGNSGPNFVSAIGLYVAFHPIGNIISTGQWGRSDEGIPFDHKSNDGIARIVIHSGWIVDFIEVQYRNNGKLEWSSVKNRPKGGYRYEIVLDDDEYLKEVKGFYGRLNEMDTINSLTFFSNKKRRFGPYGIEEGTQREELEVESTPFHVKEGKIVGFHGTQGVHYLSAIGFYIAPEQSVEALSKQIASKVAIEPVLMGACGYPGEGIPFNHPGFDGIKKIIIYCESVIHSIEVQYTKNGQIECTNKVGGNGGNFEEIVLEDGEYLKEVNGYYGRQNNMGALNSITFITNLNKTFGPYGKDKLAPLEKKSPFNVKGGKIIGFHGNTGPDFLSAIGFYVAFHLIGNVICTRQWGYPGDGFRFDHKINDGIKKIIIHCGWVIDYIDIQYKNNGQLKWSTDNIGRQGGNQREFVLDDDEYLTEVKGFYARGTLYGMDTINSLIFFTNKKKIFGPYGYVDGGKSKRGIVDVDVEEPMSFHVKKGRIVGFHGTQGTHYLSSIGFYIKPLESVHA